MKYTLRNKGFTLIELIVVIAIIGLLSTIIFTGLDIAKFKARDSAITSSVHQLRTNLEQEYTISKTYANLLGTGSAGQWIQDEGDCDSATFQGAYASQMTDICKDIIKDTVYPNDLNYPLGSLWIGPGESNITDSKPLPQQRFSIMVYLPGQKKFLCAGSDGASSLTSDLGVGIWSSPGCWKNY